MFTCGILLVIYVAPNCFDYKGKAQQLTIDCSMKTAEYEKVKYWVKLNSFDARILANVVYRSHLLIIFMVNEVDLLKCLEMRNLMVSE